MTAAVTYDDSQLQELFRQMDVKRRIQALKGAFRKEGSTVRKAAVNNLRGSIRSSRDLEKGVRSLVFKDQAGFRVTVGAKRMAAKQGDRAKPVLVWAEQGTAPRRTKGGGKRARRRSAHSTGQMTAYKYMEKTAAQVRGKVTDELHEELRKSVVKTAQKYGCKINS